METDESTAHGAPPWWKPFSGLALCGFLLVAGFYLLTEHTAHLWGVLPLLLLFSCPLMHLFHHHRHGKHTAVPPPVPGIGAGGA